MWKQWIRFILNILKFRLGVDDKASLETSLGLRIFPTGIFIISRSMITFFGFNYCPFTRKVRIVLEEKKIPYTYHEVNLYKDEHLKREFLKINPLASVPVLIDDNVTLIESNAIVAYLEESHPQQPLLPQDLLDRARVRMLESVHDTSYAPKLELLMHQYHQLKPGSRDESLIAHTFKEMQIILTFLESQIGEGKYFVNDTFSLADVAFVHSLANMSPVFNVDLTPYKGLRKWMTRVGRKASIVKTNPGIIRVPQPTKVSA